jgi:hypothetical protein
MLKKTKEEYLDLMRMVHWLGMAVMFYAIVIVMITTKGIDFYPQFQTVMWKLGHLTVASYLGYRLDISLNRKRITTDSTDLERIRRAIMVIGSMIAMALGS